MDMDNCQRKTRHILRLNKYRHILIVVVVVVAFVRMFACSNLGKTCSITPVALINIGVMRHEMSELGSQRVLIT